MRWFLESQNMKYMGDTGGHCKYIRSDLNRPIIIQSHIDPVPEFIVKQILNHLKFSKKQFHEYIQENY